jgi:thioester reductase-like protein
MSKWVAENMVGVVESRGLPVSIMRPGNMSGSSSTGAQNPSDFVFLFLTGCIELGAAPSTDTNYFFDLTPVDFAAAAVVYFAIEKPVNVMGQRVHLQNPNPPVALRTVVDELNKVGHMVASSSKSDWLDKLVAECDKERASGVEGSNLQKLEAGFASFEVYFLASSWLSYGSDCLQQALQDSELECPTLSAELLEKWFPLKK